MSIRDKYPIGTRVAAGEGEDYDTGQICEWLDDERAMVSWDSGVSTMAHLDDLEVLP